MTTLTKDLNEQLFTDLTPEEGAVIEGGVNLWLGTIKALRGTDQRENNPDNTEEVRLKTSRGTLWSGGVKVGNKGVYINKSFRNVNSSSLLVYDYDNPNSGRGRSDYMGGTSLLSKGKRSISLFGPFASHYRLSYRVY